MKKVVLFFALTVGLLTSVTTMAQTSYDLKIAGVDVTSANCSDLSVISGVSGTVKYDPTTKVLTLQNATIQTNTYAAIESSIDGLTIKVIGTNNLTTGNKAALGFGKPLTITGGGVLNANSGGDCAIYAKETNLTIDGCTVNAKGKWGIAGKNGSSETLTIKNSTVTAEGTGGGSIADFASLTMIGCRITQPAGAAFNASLKAVALGGSVVKSKVVISPSLTTCDLWIAGVQVTSANCSDLSVISGVSGTVKYDPATKVLTLQNATIQKTNNYAAIESSIDGLTIKVIGTSNLTTSKTTLYFEKPLTITGGGVLNANSGTTCAIFANEINLTIDGCTVNAKGVYGITGNNASSKMLTIKNSTVTAEGTEGSIINFADLTLDGCAITEPEGAAFDASLKAIALNGQKVKSKVVIIPALSNMSRYITLTVKQYSAIKLNFKAAANGTHISIVNGSKMQDIIVDTDWKGTDYYTAAVSTKMKIYGDLTGFDCGGNRANLTAIDVSHNTLLTELGCHDNQLSNLDVSRNTKLTYLNCSGNNLDSLDLSQNTQLTQLNCYGNAFTTEVIDDIYCALPVRQAADDARIYPLINSSDPKATTVAATNAQNAIDKNWHVKYASNGTDIATTGSYVCPPTTYDLKIAGVYVTSANCSDLSVIDSVSGTVKYDPVTNVLTLENATIQINTTNAIVSYVDGLTIKVIGTNNLTTGGSSALSFRKPLTITGGGVLNAKSGGDCGIYANGTNLTIDGCTVNAKGRYGITGENGSSETLTIKHSTVTAEGTAGSITDFASLSTIGCSITQPAGAAFDASLQAVALGGSKVTSKVVISKNSTDISEATAEPSLTLYPNPVADVLYLSSTARTIRVYNIDGIEVAHAADTDRVEVSHLPAGVYTVNADGTVAKMVKR